MVVFEAGRPKNSEYRRFKIKTVEGANDYASHQEVLRRRFRKLAGNTAQIAAETETLPQSAEEEGLGMDDAGEVIIDEKPRKQSELQHDWAIPDLIIIDGGKGQLHAAMEVMEELQLDIPIIGFAKDEGSHSKLATSESIFLPGSSEANHVATAPRRASICSSVFEMKHIDLALPITEKSGPSAHLNQCSTKYPALGQSVNRPSSNISARFGPSVRPALTS